MNLMIKIPSKTFLMGEYLALIGGPCLLLNTAPFFCLQVNDAERLAYNFSDHSPAGKLIKSKQLGGLHLNFIDPHDEQGGLGASSAQFLSIYTLFHHLGTLPQGLQNTTHHSRRRASQYTNMGRGASEQQTLFLKDDRHTSLDWLDLLSCYQRKACYPNGLVPSGADLIAQLIGGITLFEQQKKRLLKFENPFEHLTYVIIRTNVKIATHEHLHHLLEQLKPNHSEAGIEGNRTRLKSHYDFEPLKEIVLNAERAIQQHEEYTFCEAINQYHFALDQLGLIASHTQVLIQKIQDYPNLKACKGCGALGADILLAIVPVEERNHFVHFLDENNITALKQATFSNQGLKIMEMAE